jgi:hypothetical protein
MDIYINKNVVDRLYDLFILAFLFSHIALYPIIFHLTFDLNNIVSLGIGYVEIIIIILLSFCLMKVVRRVSRHFNGKLALGLLLFIQLNALFQLAFMENIENKWKWYYSNTFIMLIIFLMAYKIMPIMLEKKRGVWILAIIYVSAIPLLLFYLQQIGGIYSNRIGGSSVLAIADNIMYFGLFVVVGARSIIKKISITIFALGLLWLVGSRGALFVFIIVSIIYLVAFSNRSIVPRPKNQRIRNVLRGGLVSIVAIICIIALVRTNLEKWIGIEPFYRQYEQMSKIVLGAALDIQNDESIVRRTELMEKGLSVIKRHPMLGSYMNEFIDQNRGEYIHNVLSYGAEYGSIALLLLLALIGLISWETWKKTKGMKKDAFVFIYLVTAVIMLCTTRSYGYVHIWSAIGFAAAYIDREKGKEANVKKQAVFYNHSILQKNSRTEKMSEISNNQFIK